MASITTGLMTFEEFEQLPEYVGKEELLEGELIQLPPAKYWHKELGERLQQAFLTAVAAFRRDSPSVPIGKVHHEMGYHVNRAPDSWLVPDVSLTHPNQTRGEYYEGAPQLAVEIVSPANSAEEIERKIAIYLASGCREVWVLYPKTKRVHVHRESGTAVVTDTLEADLLPGLSIDLADLFKN